nr:uncharacterized protein LOC111752698 [Loxodonta africana]
MWPSLQALGVSPDSHIRVSVEQSEASSAQLEVALGQCTLTAYREERAEANATHVNWTLSLVNRCPLLEAAGVPRVLYSEGSLSHGPCEFDLAAGLHSDSGDAHLQLARTCQHQTAVLGRLTHSLPLLGRLGLPPSNTLSLTARPGFAVHSSLALKVGPCALQGTLEHRAGNWSEWTLGTEPGCPLLEQGLGLPAGTKFSGSLQEAEASGALATAGQAASLTLAGAMLASQATFRAKLKHTLSALQTVPPETSLTLWLRQEAGYQLGLELQVGACKLRGSGELQLERRLQWHVLGESSCEALQVPRVLLTHSLPQPSPVTLPVRTLLDLATKWPRPSYKRTLPIEVDGRQVSEEVTFAQRPQHTSLNYILQHGIPTLYTLWVGDKMGLQIGLGKRQ